MTIHTAYGIVSLFGILDHCDSFNFRKTYIYPFVDRKTCSQIISRYMARKALMA